MARSNTLPTSTPQRFDSKASKHKPISRSQTSPFHHSHTPSISTNASTARPSLPNRQNSIQTRYMNMLLDLDTIPRMHNIYASFFTYILLAGFVIFPGTFTSISSSIDDSDALKEHEAASEIVNHVKHIPLLYVAAFSSGIGATGMVWLWWRWRVNFVWLLNRIFLPGCLNSVAGLISTFVNVYSQQDGKWSITARVTVAVTGACMVITGILFALYNFWILEKVKKKHHGEMSFQGHDDEGLVEKIGRKAHEPGLEPGSVV